MQGRLFLDVIVRQSTSIFQLFSCENKSLLLRWDTFFILNLCLHILDGVIRFHIEGDRLSGQGLDENLHGTTSQSQHQIQGGFLLNVIIRESTSILQLLSSEDQSLLFRWNTFFILNLGLDILNGVIWLHIEGNGFSSQSLHEDLHRS